MEEKINIAEILKDKPQGTKLYSLTYGDCFYQEYTGDFGIECQSKNRVQFNLDEYGRYCIKGECILFPSKEMRDWKKFSWKKGDVLISNDYGTEVIFYDWYDDTYTSFYCKHYLNSEDKNKIVYYEEFLCTTVRYSLEDKNAAKAYINAIEERLDGKLNLKTLEIEKQSEFKDGDILYAEKDESHIDAIFILETVKEERGYYACLILYPYMVCKYSCGGIGNKTLRYATEKEKKQLFDALAKEGKVWDAKKKQIVNLKPKWTPKPFDRVITRTPETPWTANFFSHIDSDGIKNCIDDRYIMCLPYNDETAKLIGTTNNWRG